jgi:hypothetical protein
MPSALSQSTQSVAMTRLGACTRRFIASLWALLMLLRQIEISDFPLEQKNLIQMLELTLGSLLATSMIFSQGHAASECEAMAVS